MASSRGARLDKNDYFLLMARLASLRGTCARRTVGCILVSLDYQVLATGYNGVASGEQHCIDVPCPGANDPSGDTTRCRAIHAEINAIAQAKKNSALWRVARAYVTVMPCLDCAKALVDGCTRLEFVHAIADYPFSGGREYLTLHSVGTALHGNLQKLSLDMLMSIGERWR